MANHTSPCYNTLKLLITELSKMRFFNRVYVQNKG